VNRSVPLGGDRKPGKRSADPERLTLEMGITEIASVVSAVAVVIGLIFAGVQLRLLRLAREHELALELVHSFQTPAFAQGLFLLSELPEGCTPEELEERLGARTEHVFVLLTTWESLGVLLHRGQVTLDLLDDFFSGPIVVSWLKLKRYVEIMRERVQRETYYEWFQYLAERMSERETTRPPVPAYVEFRKQRRPRPGLPGPQASMQPDIRIGVVPVVQPVTRQAGTDPPSNA
jgi:hypothetical protein